MKKPGISVILCSHNNPEMVKSCLDSIIKQDYKDFEVLCVDGFSTDETPKVIKDYAKRDKRIRLIISKNPLPEGKGNKKWFACKIAKAPIIAIIDQDNVLQRADLFKKTLKLFEKNTSLAGVLGGLKHDIKDNLLLRYVSLYGTDPFFAYRSIDFLRNFSQKNEFALSLDNMSLTGGNCFFYKSKDLVSIGGYTQDVLVIRELIKKGKEKLAIIPSSTKHYTEKSITRLVLKFTFGKKAYYQKENEVFNYMPSTKLERSAFLKNLAFNLLFLPNIVKSINLYKKSEDGVVFLHPFLALIGTVAYAVNFIRR